MDTISQGAGRGRRFGREAVQVIKLRRPIPAIGGMREGFFVDNGAAKADVALALQKAITFLGARGASYRNSSTRILAATMRKYARA